MNEEKTKQLLVYLASTVDIGKTKLMKLLYLIDFMSYERTGAPITNDEYKHWALGPVPAGIWRGMKDGELIHGVLHVAHEERGIGTYVRYTPVNGQAPETSLFSEEELAVINEVVEEYGAMGQQELVDMLHQELPYLITRENETIPYFLAPYRGYAELSKAEKNTIAANKVFMGELKSAYKESRQAEYRPLDCTPGVNYVFASGL